ncbi:hypothetical protein ACJU26_06410 [Acidithiobacillus sp. M4-SHS-6]|uniref:hypothetical protein n=1 Tax=Acidithiobacillus sp. M4-SHS-6 TaxID=3383024 RepID=UPI0039BDDFF9
MEITVYRAAPLFRKPRTLPAVTYNLARMLQARSPKGVAFVPIRSMQVLAILDSTEFVFLDSQYKSWAMLAWQGFHPNVRTALDAPVPFECVHYEDTAREAMRRLVREFHIALEQLTAKQRIDGPAKVLSLGARRSS